MTSEKAFDGFWDHKVGQVYADNPDIGLCPVRVGDQVLNTLGVRLPEKELHDFRLDLTETIKRHEEQTLQQGEK